MAEPQINEVELFGSDVGPYGDAYINPRRPKSYRSTMHMLVEPGQMVPFFRPTERSFPSSDLAEWTVPIEWIDSNGDPTIYIIGGANAAGAYRVGTDGALILDNAFTGKQVDPNIGNLAAVLHSDGGQNARLFACFRDAGDKIESKVFDGAWGDVTGTPDEADGLFSENGNLWAVVNGYQVRKWPAGTNPVTGNASAVIDVGDASYVIRGAGLLGRSYVIFVKADGIYIYDIDTNRFENIWEGLSKNPHPDTGKGTYTWGSDVYVPLGWGGIVRVTRDLDVVNVSPLPPEASPDFTVVGRGHIRALAGDSSHLWVGVAPFQQRLNPPSGMLVLTTKDQITFNDRTSAVTDDDPATSFTFADLDPVTDSAIYVGWIERFHAPFLVVTAPSGESTITSRGLEYWNGSAWTALTVIDYIDNFSRTGPRVPKIQIPDDWEQNAVDGNTRYWLRMRGTSGSVQTDTEVHEIRLLPDVAALPAGTSVGFTGLDDAGLMTHWLKGSPRGRSFHWDDVAAHLGDFSLGLIFTQVLAPAGGRSLMAIGHSGYLSFPVGATGRPQEERFPATNTALRSFYRTVYDDRLKNDQRAPTTIKGIRYVDIYGRNLNREDGDDVEVWYRWDGGDPVFIGRVTKFPARLLIPTTDSSRGYTYTVETGLEDIAVNEKVPAITRIVAGVYAIEGTPEKV